MANLFIGTSGWVYSHWEGIFYPKDLPSKDKLKYFSQNFKTTEINYSFYHLPRPATYQKWYLETPAGFIFAVKASRFITHIKRLKAVKEAWQQFVENAFNLKEKLGPILFQFPPSFKATEENIKRLKDFLKFITGYALYPKSYILRFAFEFRHESWCDEKIYKILKKYNVAWVIACPPIGWSLKATGRRADSPRYPKVDVVTTDFVYIRMHGSKVLFSSKYTKEELNDLAKKIKKWLKQRLDVYCYFNNDAYGYAIENAKELFKILK
ncbi:hypothetical protein AMJ49_00600 [Parcubacteria bacterium DG_74_2]|nr:MAG: hypothetical protein AMJ49_00600 [Parcubacteria bacterium DG_74_2]